MYSHILVFILLFRSPGHGAFLLIKGSYEASHPCPLDEQNVLHATFRSNYGLIFFHKLYLQAAGVSVEVKVCVSLSIYWSIIIYLDSTLISHKKREQTIESKIFHATQRTNLNKQCQRCNCCLKGGCSTLYSSVMNIQKQILNHQQLQCCWVFSFLFLKWFTTVPLSVFQSPH